MTGVLVTLEFHLVDTAALWATVVLELVVEVEVDGVVRVGGVTGASDDSAGPLFGDRRSLDVARCDSRQQGKEAKTKFGSVYVHARPK